MTEARSRYLAALRQGSTRASASRATGHIPPEEPCREERDAHWAGWVLLHGLAGLAAAEALL